jgi:hypothetical protein
MAEPLHAVGGVSVVASPHVPVGEVWFIPREAPQCDDYTTDAEWRAALEQWARSVGHIVNVA